MNSAKCLNCGDVLVSVHVHDFVTCSCFENKEGNTGIFIDGGDEYCRYGGNFDNFKWIDEIKD